MTEARTQTEAQELCWIDYLAAHVAWEQAPCLRSWLIRQAAHEAFTAVYTGETKRVH